MNLIIFSYKLIDQLYIYIYIKIYDDDDDDDDVSVCARVFVYFFVSLYKYLITCYRVFRDFYLFPTSAVASNFRASYLLQIWDRQYNELIILLMSSMNH